MATGVIQNEIFGKDYSSLNNFNKGEYESCTFKNCDFSQADLSNFTFIDCRFELCNLSMAKVRNTGLKSVRFINCKLLGVNFATCFCYPSLLRIA